MKVPRINVGVVVVLNNCMAMIDEVDCIEKKFRMVSKTHVNWCYIADYDPAPTMNNFLRAITEWDYHYRASDDPRLYEEGQDYEKALIALLKALPVADQHQLQKIVEIVVISNQP